MPIRFKQRITQPLLFRNSTTGLLYRPINGCLCNASAFKALLIISQRQIAARPKYLGSQGHTFMKGIVLNRMQCVVMHKILNGPLLWQPMRHVINGGIQIKNIRLVFVYSHVGNPYSKSH